MRSSVLLLLAACTPPLVEVDGRRHPDLERAVEALEPGSTLRLLTEVPFEAGIVVPDGVHIVGPGELYATTGTVITAEGALFLEDLTLRGGDSEHGSAVHSGDLDLFAVTVTEGSGAYAVVAEGSVRIEQSTLEHPAGTALETRSPVGRPPRAELVDVVVSGHLAPHADTGTLTGITADTVAFRGLSLDLSDVRAGSLQVDADDLALSDVIAGSLDGITDDGSFRDSTFGGLDLDGRTLLLDAVQVGGAASLTGGSAQLVGIDGGTWQAEVDQLTALDVEVRAFGGHPRLATLSGVEALLLDLQGVEQLDATGLVSPAVRLGADALSITDLTGLSLEVAGYGTLRGITLSGVEPRLYALGPQLEAVILDSAAGPARVTLDAAGVDGLIVVEPPDTLGGIRFDTNTYAFFEYVSWLGGSRTALTPDDHPVWLYHSLLDVHALGTVGNETALFRDTAQSVLEDVPQVFGLEAGDPGFVGPGDPTLLPDAPFPDRGAFASDHAALLVERWNALR